MSVFRTPSRPAQRFTPPASRAFIHPTADVSPKAKLGAGTKVWNQAQVREGAVLGKNCIVGKNAYVDVNVKVGNGVKIQNNASLYAPCVLEADVFIGPGVTTTNDRRPRAFIWNAERHAPPITVKKGASVGADSVLIGGVTIGAYAMVGAGSIVTHDVPSHALVYGNPARVQGFVCTCGERLHGGQKTAKGWAFACTACGEKTTIPAADYAHFEADQSRGLHPAERPAYEDVHR